jgi:glutamate/tyrosine decarboxylase-like PLP-dependent enzyme
MLDRDSLKLLAAALERLDAGFAELPQFVARPTDRDLMVKVLAAAADRLQDNYPYFHPLYAGQMLKPPHPVAQMVYALAQWINPNNHAIDGGRATSAMEKEAVAGIARMFGWEEHLGHLCGGGTMANLEALWAAGQLAPDKRILASEQAHYTHRRISGVLKLPFTSVPCDAQGRMDLAKLQEELERGDVGTVVVTMGTTATGSIDPLAEILELRERHGFRVHADAAYGGYFLLAGNLAEATRHHFDLLCRVDSIVIDPHKHGLQPYGCGCVLFRDPGVGQLYKHDSPYTYFSSRELHLGEISLECSRAGAAAAALWATQELLPLTKGGEFARRLDDCRTAALDLYGRLRADDRFIAAFPPELDIVIFAPRAASASEASERARLIFNAAAGKNLHLALAQLPVAFLGANLGAMKRDRETIRYLRSVLMKPEHKDWIGRIWELLSEATDQMQPFSN